MPGGKIAFYYGILEKLRLDDDEVAAIMGHEVAHALREHARERVGKSTATNVVVELGSALLGLGNLGRYAAGLGAQLVNRRFSRDDESEADLVGIELAARAGYDPAAAVRLWEKMMTASKGAPPQWLSTHPTNTSRIRDIQANLPKVEGLYARAARPPQRFPEAPPLKRATG
jgi:Zn-dependent protease with chaperone function